MLRGGGSGACSAVHSSNSHARMLCRHRQTVLMLAVTLSCKERTQDYRWQLQQYLEAVAGDHPATAHPHRRRPGRYCRHRRGLPAGPSPLVPLAHPLESHEEPRAPAGVRLQSVCGRLQVRSGKHIKANLRGAVGGPCGGLATGKAVAGPGVDAQRRYWASWAHDRFSTGAVSTQRGEGLNCHFKKH